MDEQNRVALSQLVEKRRAYLQAKQGTEEDMRAVQTTLSRLGSDPTKPLRVTLLPDEQQRTVSQGKGLSGNN